MGTPKSVIARHVNQQNYIRAFSEGINVQTTV